MPSFALARIPWSRRAAGAAKSFLGRHPVAATGLGSAAAGAATIPLGKEKARKKRKKVEQLLSKYRARPKTQDSASAIRTLSEFKEVLDTRLQHPARTAMFRAIGAGALGAGGVAAARKARQFSPYIEFGTPFRRARSAGRKPPSGKGKVIDVEPISVKVSSLLSAAQWAARHPTLIGLGIGATGVLIGKAVEQPPAQRAAQLKDMIREEGVLQEVEPTYGGQRALGTLRERLAHAEAAERYPARDVLHKLQVGALGGALAGFQTGRLTTALTNIFRLGAMAGAASAGGG